MPSARNSPTTVHKTISSKPFDLGGVSEGVISASYTSGRLSRESTRRICSVRWRAASRHDWQNPSARHPPLILPGIALRVCLEFVVSRAEEFNAAFFSEQFSVVHCFNNFILRKRCADTYKSRHFG